MKTTPRSRLLLIELICDLVIFSLCAVVCVTLLVQARAMSRESAELTQAVYLAQSAAETWKAGATLPAGTDELQVTVTESFDEESSRHCNVIVSKDGRVLFTLEGVAAP